MPSDLHGMVATAAANAGTTINEFINRAVTKELEKNFLCKSQFNCHLLIM